MSTEVKIEKIRDEHTIQKSINPNFWQELREYIFYFLRLFIVVGVIYAVVRFFVFDLIGVEGESMYPTFNESTTKDAIYIDLLTPRFSGYRRGDVVVMIPPEGCYRGPKDEPPYYIKRIIGLPGEQVAFENGEVYIINEQHPSPGVRLDESEYLPENVDTYKGTKNASGQRIEEPVVPEGHYYFMGDNRTNSIDSRVCGPVEKSRILGREFFRLTPPSKRDTFELPDYNIANQVNS
jgi:signal peptidase I